MSQFDDLIDDAAARFGLGPKAGALFHELQQLVTASPGGIGGFIDKFQSAGLSREVNGWLGNPEGAALSSSQVDRALGSDTIDAVARKVGIPSATAAAALGYLTPKLIGRLTPLGEIPSSESDFARAAASAAARRRMRAASAGSAGQLRIRWRRKPASPPPWRPARPTGGWARGCGGRRRKPHGRLEAGGRPSALP